MSVTVTLYPGDDLVVVFQSGNSILVKSTGQILEVGKMHPKGASKGEQGSAVSIQKKDNRNDYPDPNCLAESSEPTSLRSPHFFELPAEHPSTHPPSKPPLNVTGEVSLDPTVIKGGKPLSHSCYRTTKTGTRRLDWKLVEGYLKEVSANLGCPVDMVALTPTVKRLLKALLGERKDLFTHLIMRSQYCHESWKSDPSVNLEWLFRYGGANIHNLLSGTLSHPVKKTPWETKKEAGHSGVDDIFGGAGK